MKINIQNKKVLIAGIQGSGKTYLARHMIRDFKAMAYVANQSDWKNENIILTNPNDFVGEFPFWCKMAKSFALKRKINLFIADDIDTLFKSHFDTSPELRDIVINHRHYGLTLIFITHRIQDVPAKIYGQFEILCLFSMESPQAIDLMNRYYEGLGDMVRSLPYGSHEFIYKHIGMPPRKMMI